MLSRLLTGSGHQVTEARSVGESLKVAAGAAFDLVISDLGLPDGSGTEMMAQLRDRFGLRGIALSGYGMKAEIARSLAAGFTAHLTKPVDYNQLKRVLRDFSS